MEIDSAVFAHAIVHRGIFVTLLSLDEFDVAHLAVNFIGGGIYERSPRRFRAHRLQNVQSSERVHFEIKPRIRDRSRDRHLSGKMKNERRVAVVSKGLPNRGAIAYVDRGKIDRTLPLDPLQIFSGALPVEIVKEYDFIAPLQIPAYGVDADESGPTCDNDLHSVTINVHDFYA